MSFLSLCAGALIEVLRVVNDCQRTEGPHSTLHGLGLASTGDVNGREVRRTVKFRDSRSLDFLDRGMVHP